VMPTTNPTVLAEQVAGSRPCGEVTLRDFDQGLVETLGGRVIDGQYYVTIDGVEPPPGDPAIPVLFFFPEDMFSNYRFPAIVVTRDDISLATSRLHPGMQQYRAPAKTGLPTKVQTPQGVVTYYTRTVQQAQATPYDITYTINLYSSLRGGFGGRKAANAMLDFVLRKWPVYGQVFVTDSLGERRSYEAFNEGVAALDDVATISERTIQFAVTVRVEAEYDLSPEVVLPTVTAHPISNFTKKVE